MTVKKRRWSVSGVGPVLPKLEHHAIEAWAASADIYQDKKRGGGIKNNRIEPRENGEEDELHTQFATCRKEKAQFIGPANRVLWDYLGRSKKQIFEGSTRRKGLLKS